MEFRGYTFEQLYAKMPVLIQRDYKIAFMVYCNKEYKQLYCTYEELFGYIGYMCSPPDDLSPIARWGNDGCVYIVDPAKGLDLYRIFESRLYNGVVH